MHPSTEDAPGLYQPDLSQVFRQSLRYLRCFEDPTTRNEAEEWAGEVVETIWAACLEGRLRRFGDGLVRAVARRLRANRLRQLARERRRVPLDDDVELERVVEPGPEPLGLYIAGKWVDGRDLLEDLPAVLSRLCGSRRRALTGFYAGSSCAQLAELEQTSISSIKARLSRGRVELRTRIESLFNPETGELRGACPTPDPQP